MLNKKGTLIGICVSLLIGHACAYGQGFVCDRTFVGVGDLAPWEESGNWFPASVPGPTDNVCIPAGKWALIYSGLGDPTSHQACKGVKVEAGGKLHLGGEETKTSLTISGDSIVDGEFMIGAGADLYIDGDLTIEGTGRIFMSTEFGLLGGGGDNNIPNIKPSDPTSRLTLKGIHAGSWTPDEWDDQTGTLVLTGAGHIEVELVNQAHVKTAEEASVSTSPACCDVPLWIEAPASGDGFWIAEGLGQISAARYDNGVLEFLDAVSGSGTFVVVNDDGDIQINALPGALTGDVLMEAGKLTVNFDFDTSGDLVMNAGTIEVADTKCAYFD